MSVFESCDVLASADAHVAGPRHSCSWGPSVVLVCSNSGCSVPPYPQMSGSIHRRAVCTPLAGCGAMCKLGILLANMPRASGQMTVGQCANVPTGEPLRQSSSPAHFAGAAHSLYGCQPCRRGGEALSNTVPLRGSMCCTAVVEACRIQFMDRPQAPKTDSVSPPSNQGPLTGEEEQRPERNPLLDTTGPTRKGLLQVSSGWKSSWFVGVRVVRCPYFC